MILDQAYAHMPEVVAYLRFETSAEITTENVSAVLAQKALVTESVSTLADSGEGTLYIILVDVSTSMGGPQLQAIKSSLNDLIDNMSENDRVTLITFANAPTILVNGGEDRDELRSEVDNLSIIDGDTSLNDALVMAAELSQIISADLPNHRVAVVITDGINEKSGTGYTNDDVSESMQNVRLPIFTLIVRGAYGMNQDAIFTLSSLSLNSGGKATYVSNESMSEALLDHQALVQKTMKVVFKASSNQISGENEKLQIQVVEQGSIFTVTYELPINSFQPDNEPPTATVSQKDENSVLVVFSKPVIGANEPGNYSITSNRGKQLTIIGATYSETGDDISTLLVLGDKIYSGEYQIRFFNITDNSQEMNPITDVLTFRLEGNPATQQYFELLVTDFWWIVLIIVLLLVIIVVYRLIKKNRGIVRVNDKIGFGEAVEFQQHFSTPESNQIYLIVTDSKEKSTPVVMDINKSVFVGRSKENNLSFDDVKLSRQHFAIELDDGEYYLIDLDSTNGSYLNGVPVHNRRILKENDVITAGNEKFVFKGPVVR
ncbi:MAG: VWA domain-containing protein [Coriobacteriia bacterium]|nr:VWA domain-containing protein [Coriobacteriia bacterium]